MRRVQCLAVSTRLHPADSTIAVAKIVCSIIAVLIMLKARLIIRYGYTIILKVSMGVERISYLRPSSVTTILRHEIGKATFQDVNNPPCDPLRGNFLGCRFPFGVDNHVVVVKFIGGKGKRSGTF